MSETCTFEQALKHAALDGLVWKKEQETKGKEEHYKLWSREMKQWLESGRKSGRTSLPDELDQPIRAPKFAAIPMIVATLPFDMLEDDKKTFTDRELEKINWFRLYYSLPNISWARGPETNYDGPPYFPPAFEQWMDNNHNRCTWWLNYCAYERANNFSTSLITLDN